MIRTLALFAISLGLLNGCGTAPANAPSALTAAATTMGDSRTASSNFGTCIDIFAPGEDILSTWLGGATATASGTSQAAPHVAGVAALYLEDEPGAPPLSATTASVTDVILGHGTPGKVANAGTGSPNLLLFSDVPDNPRTFSISLENTTFKNNGKGKATFSWNTANVFSDELDFYVNEAPDGTPKKTTPNTGTGSVTVNNPVFNSPFEIQACEAGSTVICSNVIEVNFFYFKIKLKKTFINQSSQGVAKITWNKNKVPTNKIDVYVNEIPDGTYEVRTRNDGVYKVRFADPGAGPYEIRACHKNSETRCSNLVTADFADAPIEYEPDPYDEPGDEHADQ